MGLSLDTIASTKSSGLARPFSLGVSRLAYHLQAGPILR